MRNRESIYIAIIITLVVHGIIISALSLVLIVPENQEFDEDYYSEIEMDFMELEETDPNEYLTEIQDRLDQEIKNIVANMEAERTSNPESYSSAQSEQLKKDIEAKVKAYEEEFFKEANANSDQEKYKKKDDDISSDIDTDKYDYFKNDKSHSGPVSVSFKLSGRDPRNLRKPTYRCKQSGIVVVNIVVAYTGEVIQAEINTTGTNTGNECLLSESLKYAKLSTFNSSIEAPKKQNGQIIYTFAAQ